MTKRYRTFLFFIFFFILTFLSWKLSGSVFPNGNDAIWYHSGLLMVILGMYWVEHYFTKPQDVFSNGLVAFISISILNDPPLAYYWNLLRYYSLGLSIISLIIILSGSPSIEKNDTSQIKRFFYDIVTRFGSAQILFSLIFILSLMSFFDGKLYEIQWMLIFWGIVITFKYLDIEGILKHLPRKKQREKIIGIVTKIIDPNIIRFTLNKTEHCSKGELVVFTEKGEINSTSLIGIVTGYRKSPDVVEVETIILDSQYSEGKIDKRVVVIKPTENSRVFQQLKEENHLLSNIENLIGFVGRGSDVSRIYFEVVKNSPILVGHLVSVPLGNKINIFYQVINAQLKKEDTIHSNERVYSVCEAEQIGVWNKEEQGFETYSWVTKENSPIFYVPKQNKNLALPTKNLSTEIGHVPNSDFPIKLDLHNLVLHHSALLGVTGCGKTYLAYEIIEQCIKDKIKVFCIDITGDYKRYLNGAVVLNNTENTTIEQFLDSPDYYCAILEPSVTPHPIVTTKNVTYSLLNWCKTHRSDDEIGSPKAKVLLVYEEAHMLIPEFTFNPDRSLQGTVNETSRIVLQARKYGLGFMVVTQRTANVTKSILNQCNTIAAFQAFDKTGYEFMQNYMGEHWVKTIPNLARFESVLVGKASLSRKPIIVKLNEQQRNIGDGKLPVFPPPA